MNQNLKIIPEEKDIEKILKKYQVAKKPILDYLKQKCEEYSKMPMDYLERIGFEKGCKTEYIPPIADCVLLIDKEYIKFENSPERIAERTKNDFLELISGKTKKWADATEILVKYILDNNYLYTTKDDNKSEVWIYREGIYIPQGRSEIKIILRKLLGNWYSQYIYGLVIAKIEPDTSIDSKQFFDNVFTYEVPVLNGILNIKTRELSEFTPKKIFFTKMPVKYNPNVNSNEVDKFLNDIFPDEEDKKVFFELGGFCLLNEYKYEKAFMFVGNGRNGKDKSIELIKRVIGIENCSGIPINSLKSDSFVLSELFNKKANLAGEISSKDLGDTSTFKALTGRSLISAKRKFLPNINFVNYAKFVFACNELPMVYDTSRGFWDRWILLEFPYTFVSQEEYDSSKDKSFLKVRDVSIIEKICTPTQLSGLLNKFLDGLDRLETNGGFSTTKGTDEIKNMWIRKSNSFIAFCMDKIKEDPEGRITKKLLRKKYVTYCKGHKIKSLSDFVIKKFLQEEYGATEIDTQELNQRITAWEGIKWKGK